MEEWKREHPKIIHPALVSLSGQESLIQEIKELFRIAASRDMMTRRSLSSYTSTFCLKFNL
jgi:hypothetical protein